MAAKSEGIAQRDVELVGSGMIGGIVQITIRIRFRKGDSRRDDAVFHDGTKVTAADFKWSLERAANPDTASPTANTY